MSSATKIGLALVAARRACGLPQKSLAERVGVRQQQVARWESSCYAGASIDSVARVAEALGCAILLEDGCEDCTRGALVAESTGQYSSCGRAVGAEPVRDLAALIRRIRSIVEELQERFGVRRVDVFGSFATGEQDEFSDVDVLLDFERPTVHHLLGAERRLSEALARPVEAGTLDGLNPRVLERVMGERVRVWPT